MVTNPTSPRVTRTCRHCHGVNAAVAAMNDSTSAVWGPNLCAAASLAI